MMHMTFYWSKEVTLLVNSWRTNSWLSYSLSLLACFIVSVFYQYLENYRIRLKLLQCPKPSPSEIEAPLLRSKVAGKFQALRFAGALFFGVNSAIGYLLMLAIMSFNGGVFVAIVFGLAIGYLVFRSDDEDVIVSVENPCACA
ncbi:copper transporter 5.1 [Cucumis melo var. makuwa]|uniref:Copper transport protein n=1 Tax=Cucumis melo var. makuwa TaxID=1194695 RepID=A0A5D3BRJ7_CUCMM|nr:copper transporter 5.1 [Cucumis melo var. makuwa]TYK00719.1 copper transporter 5.1 [Cucumis melo var. makuwa]